jgi:hypothetical protein
MKAAYEREGEYSQNSGRVVTDEDVTLIQLLDKERQKNLEEINRIEDEIFIKKQEIKALRKENTCLTVKSIAEKFDCTTCTVRRYIKMNTKTT